MITDGGRMTIYIFWHFFFFFRRLLLILVFGLSSDFGIFSCARALTHMRPIEKKIRISMTLSCCNLINRRNFANRKKRERAKKKTSEILIMSISINSVECETTHYLIFFLFNFFFILFCCFCCSLRSLRLWSFFFLFTHFGWTLRSLISIGREIALTNKNAYFFTLMARSIHRKQSSRSFCCLLFFFCIL